MAFASKRGRPKKDISEIEAGDKGTPELRQKRQLSQTTEAIDLLLQYGVIDAQQHWCALHYRWLYTLRYGSPTVQSMDPAYVRGIVHKKEYEEWQRDRELEWNDIQRELMHWGCKKPVMEVCIFNVFCNNNKKKVLKGLATLVQKWCNVATYE